MQALVISDIGQTIVKDIDQPELGAKDVLVKVRHVGLCGSDLATFRGLNPLSKFPRIPGHEIGGSILAVGDKVPTEFGVGSSVIVVPYTACGKCSSCKKSKSNACRHNQTLGVQRDGGMSESIAVPFDKIILNNDLKPEQLALVEPLSVGFHAMARAKVRRGEEIVVLGAGMIGMGAVLSALNTGANVTVVELSEEKKQTLYDLGVDSVLNPAADDVAAEVSSLNDGQGPDVVVEAVGIPETFRAAIDYVGFGGSVVYVGYSKAEVSYDTTLFNLKELDIFGSRNAGRADFEDVIAFLQKNPSVSDLLISHIFSWGDAMAAFEYWEEHRSKTFKVMIEFEQ